MLTKSCTKCGEVKPFTDFPSYPGGRPKSWCRACQTSHVREKRHATPKIYKRRQPNPTLTPKKYPVLPEARRRWKLKEKFGITQQDYDAMGEAQGYRCAICNQPERRTIRGNVIVLAVDHNHATGKVRGLLCHACNVGVGMFRESPELLQNAIEYIQLHLAASDSS